MTDASATLETPSGKGAKDENFPVGSVLIARDLRPTVFAYYAFARNTDDIADNPDLAPEEKVRRLDAFDAGLLAGATGPAIATDLRDHLAERGIGTDVASDLLVAFRQDALKARYKDWDDLIGYCRYSAYPVGRFLLRLHGEDHRTEAPGDALCAALQVLNHLQDIGPDRQRLDRVYLPTEWLAEAGVPAEALDAPAASPGLRTVIERCLDGCDTLLDRSEPLAGMIRSRRLAAEVAVIQRLARRLAGQLRRRDPVAVRVEHRKIDLALGFAEGLRRFLLHRLV